MCLRYGIDCRRVGCYFKHPEGRLIDNAQHGGVVERRGGSTGATGYDAGKTVMAELTNGFSSTYVLLLSHIARQKKSNSQIHSLKLKS